MAPGPAPRARPGTRPWPWIGAVAVVLVALVVAVLAGGGGDDDGSPAATQGLDQTAPVTVTGTALPTLEDGTDTAVGRTAPVLAGTSFDGSPITIGPGRPAIVVFLAHWCPHCQRELPLLVDLQEDGAFEGMRTSAVLTGTDPNAPNYPPADWLVREGWEGNVLLDDQQSTGATAYGLTGYPYLVFLNANGEVVARADGELPVDTIEAYLDEARGEG